VNQQDGTSPIYHSYYKYLITQDRNGELKIKITERLEDGTEQSYTYDLNSLNDARMVYKSESGEVFEVVGSYNVSADQRVSAYYQMAYWVQDAEGNWTHNQTPNLATNLMLRDKNGKVYQIPVVSNNLLVSCDQYTGGKQQETLLDYTTVYTYKNDTGLIETTTLTGADNFRRLYGKFLEFSLHDMIDVDKFQAEYGMTPAEFVKANAAYATFKYSVRDMADNMNVLSYPEKITGEIKNPVAEEKLWTDPNVRDVTIRLYSYSATMSIITISTREDVEPLAVFCVETGYCEQILDAARKVLSGDPVEPLREIVERLK
jgi:hypothetical protein